MPHEKQSRPLAAPPPSRTIGCDEDEVRYYTLADFILSHYNPASDEELRITNEILHGTWLMQHWKHTCAKARRHTRELKLNLAPSAEISQAREHWRFCEWHATKQALFTARRKKAFAALRAEYEMILAESGHTIEEARQAWLAAFTALTDQLDPS
jgi:predicted ATPase